MALSPTEAYTPSIVDTNAVLSETFSREFLQALARRDSKILQHLGRIEDQQFPERNSLN
jgi:hypothetical protein